MTAPRLIGAHGSAEGAITFYEDFSSGPSTIKAKVGGIFVPVILPEMVGFSSVEKVERALKNRHLQPITVSLSSPATQDIEMSGSSIPQTIGEVRFNPIPAKGKVWEKAGELALPEGSLFTDRRDGLISYSFMNTIVTWNWVCNTTTTQTYGTDHITALAERADGSLIVGDAKGRLHVGSRVIPTGSENQITAIFPVNTSCCVIQFRGRSISLFDWGIERSIFELPEVSDFLIFENETVVFIKASTVIVWDVRSSEYVEWSYCKGVIEAFEISKTKALFLYEDLNTFAIFDSEKKEVGELYENKGLWSLLHRQKRGVLIEDQLFVGGSSSADAEIFVYSTSDWTSKPLGLARLGFAVWDVDAMTLLTDGSLACGTRTSNSGMHIVTTEGEEIFSQSKELTKNESIQLITELVDGSIAVWLRERVLILQPKRQASLPVESDSDYVSSFLTALKCHDSYHARRFYEKATKAAESEEEKKELCEIFLSSLEQTPYTKLRRQVLWDLWALKKTEDLPRELEEKKGRYKKRLFVCEGDFSFTQSFIKKHEATHPGLPQSVTATELLKPTDGVMERVKGLSKVGTAVFFGMDATKIHQSFQGRRFERIQWNCPFGGPFEADREKFKSVIPEFFLSASQLQLSGDRIHVTLVQKSGSYWKTRQRENPIVLGSSNAGYRLIRKRRFGTGESGRYPGYQHVMTAHGEKYSKSGQEEEFIFEKTGLGPKTTLAGALELKDPAKKEYEVKADPTTLNPELKECYFECSTDEDSSDGYQSD